MKLNSSDKALVALSIFWNLVFFPTMLPDENRDFKGNLLPYEYRYFEHAFQTVVVVTFVLAVIPARVLIPFIERANSNKTRQTN